MKRRTLKGDATETKYWIIAVVVLVIGYIVFCSIRFARKMSKRQQEGLARVAAAFGAQFDPGSRETQPRIRGTMRDRQFEITFRAVGSGKSSETYLDVKVNTEPKDFQLLTYKVTFGLKLFKKIGLFKPIPSGDPYFDEKVAVYGKPKEAVLPLLYKSRFKEAAMKLTQRGYKIEVVPGSAEIVIFKVYSEEDDLDETVLRDDIETLIHLADSTENR